MTKIGAPLGKDDRSIYALPKWVTSGAADPPETVAFSSGAALAVLDLGLVQNKDLPSGLLRDRLALKSAVACLALEGRTGTEVELRDAICLTRAGDAVGPAGDMFARWRRLSRIDLLRSGWQDAVGACVTEVLGSAATAESLPRQSTTPVVAAAEVLSQMLRHHPRAETAGLMMADVALARGMGWRFPLPLLAAQVSRRAVRGIAAGDMATLAAVQSALIAASDQTLRAAADLSRRAARLASVRSKLRSKGADAALPLFLSFDAVAPSQILSPIVRGTDVAMTDRAARRLCDRLVELGAVRELTGRATFRLYGL